MEYIELKKDNIDDNHICCALGAKQYEKAVTEKKSWLKDRMADGLVFYRLNERAKVFIEYLPAEKAWVPISAPNFMYINCLWVSGRYKNSGHAKHLLDKCAEDAKSRGMDGIVHIVGKKKLPYLSDKHFFEHMGFTLQDEAKPYFQLMSLTWNEHAALPVFKKQVKSCSFNDEGITIFYTAQCPFAVGVLEDLKELTEKKGLHFQAHRLSSKDKAQTSPAIWTTFSVFYNGEFLTHEMMSVNKFEKLLNKLLMA
ncbi:GNAT family N-acetyltransferase [Bacillus sp. 1021]|uniref:GNAT family N-acetyltransferase n=1 Tax=Bacillus TaxID=1386 RepID=UPI0005F97008|nr:MULTISPECIES: GNAT family N-acetyltransferase [Bacillus]MBD0406412.1 GNAT family N-acetyltransferase [Bacillus sp. 1021]PIK32000.1 GNAT family N-acetyltransferase [Bacillus siamensis]QQD83779.1 GNAT family N-acetyltransferase [Bacillus siamensis]